ncbi:MAG: hypothetical protein U0R77_02980 [Mycolicibacterium insubricum]|nr:hypothetical protein [Mycobacterium sp.]
MDVMLGVAVDGDRGQIAMLDAGPGHAVIDEAVVVLGEQSVDELIARLVATDRSLGDDGHRLVSTRVCCEDPDVAAAISGGLITAGLANVAAVSASEAVSGAMPVHGETAALSLGTGSLAQEVALTGASESLLSAEASAATGMAPAVDVMATGVAPVVDSGATSMAPAMDSDATSMAPATGDETMVVPAGTDPLLNTERQQLAYSLDPDLEPAGEVTAYGPAAAAEAGYVDTGYGDYDDYGYEDGYEEEPEQRDRRPLLIGSTVAAFMIVGFATLAVSVAVSIKPTSSAQALRLQDDAVPGKYFPVAPGQGVQPDGNAWTMIEEAAPATGAAVGTPAVRTFQPLALGPSTQTAAQTAAQTVRVYPDGAMTVGGAPVPAVTPAVPDAGTAVGAVIPGAVPGVIVPRAPILTSLIIGNVLREAVQLGPLNPNNYNTKPKPGDQFNVDPSGSSGASTPGVSSPGVSSPEVSSPENKSEGSPESSVSSPSSPGESPESTPSSASASSEASPTPSTRASESETPSSTRASESSTKQSEPESTANSTPKASESVPSSANRSAEQSPAESRVQSPVQSPVHESPAVESPAESPAVQSPAVQSPAAASPVEQAPVVQSPVQQAPVQQQQQAPVQQSVQEAPAEAPSRSGRSPSVSLPTTESSGGGIFGGGSGGYGRGGGIFGGGSGN